MAEVTDGGVKRCSYGGCSNPDESRHFYQIDGGSKSGGQDWSNLAGRILCHLCYTQFRKKGRLERTLNKPLGPSFRRCTYSECRKPEVSRHFHQVRCDSEAGNQDWSSVDGKVLCDTCYKYYFERGTLDRTMNRPLLASSKRCSYGGCESPLTGRKYHEIDERSCAGGQDWSSLKGQVLCMNCYHFYSRNGSLERTLKRRKVPPIPAMEHKRIVSAEDGGTASPLPSVAAVALAAAAAKHLAGNVSLSSIASAEQRHRRQQQEGQDQPRSPTGSGGGGLVVGGDPGG